MFFVWKSTKLTKSAVRQVRPEPGISRPAPEQPRAPGARCGRRRRRRRSRARRAARSASTCAQAKLEGNGPDESDGVPSQEVCSRRDPKTWPPMAGGSESTDEILCSFLTPILRQSEIGTRSKARPVRERGSSTTPPWCRFFAIFHDFLAKKRF